MQQYAPHNLRTRREALGLSQTEVAFAIGRSFQTYRLYELGSYAPSAKHLPALANVLGCRVEDLFEDVDA